MYINITVDIEDFKVSAEGILKHIRPEWNFNDVEIKPVEGKGLMQILQKCRNVTLENDDVIIFRVYDEFDEEKQRLSSLICNVLQKEELCSPIYCRFNNGNAYKYEQGATITTEQMMDPNIYKKIISSFHKLHQVNINKELGKPMYEIYPACMDVFTTTIKSTLPDALFNDESYKRDLPSRDEILKECDYGLQLYDDMKKKYPLVLCHSDGHRHNIIYNPFKDRVTLIDWDSLGMCMEVFEIAVHWEIDIDIEGAGTHIIENEMFKSKWLQCYLQTHPAYRNTPITDDLVGAWLPGLNMSMYLSAYFLVPWSIVEYCSKNRKGAQSGQARLEFDHLKFALHQLKRAAFTKALFTDEPVAGIDV